MSSSPWVGPLHVVSTTDRSAGTIEANGFTIFHDSAGRWLGARERTTGPILAAGRYRRVAVVGRARLRRTCQGDRGEPAESDQARHRAAVVPVNTSSLYDVCHDYRICRVEGGYVSPDSVARCRARASTVRRPEAGQVAVGRRRPRRSATACGPRWGAWMLWGRWVRTRGKS